MYPKHVHVSVGSTNTENLFYRCDLDIPHLLDKMPNDFCPHEVIFNFTTMETPENVKYRLKSKV